MTTPYTDGRYRVDDVVKYIHLMKLEIQRQEKNISIAKDNEEKALEEYNSTLVPLDTEKEALLAEIKKSQDQIKIAIELDSYHKAELQPVIDEKKEAVKNLKRGKERKKQELEEIKRRIKEKEEVPKAIQEEEETHRATREANRVLLQQKKAKLSKRH
jgi:hypothetical protein